jgi:hypothetical protein
LIYICKTNILQNGCLFEEFFLYLIINRAI